MTPQYFYIDSGLYAGMVKNYVGLKGTLGSLVNYGSVALATPIAVSSMVPDHLRWTINEDL